MSVPVPFQFVGAIQAVKDIIASCQAMHALAIAAVIFIRTAIGRG